MMNGIKNFLLGVFAGAIGTSFIFAMLEDLNPGVISKGYQTFLS